MSYPEPFQTTDKADVVIYDRRSGIVTTVADWNLSIPSAEQLERQLRDNLAPAFNALTLPAGGVNVGTKILEPEPIPLPPPRKLTRGEQRKANCQCVRCGAPEIVSRNYCQGCLEKANERSARSQRKLRDVQEIG